MASDKKKTDLQNSGAEQTSGHAASDSGSGFDPRSLRFLKPIIPTGVVAAVVIGSLAGYQAPTFKASTASAASTSSEKDAAKSAKDSSDSSKKSSGKTSAKKLPSVSTVSESGKNDSSSANTAASSSGTAKKLSTVSDSGKTYKDGTYTGSAQGFGGPIKVKVTIKNGKIASVVVTSHSGETPAFYNKAKVLAGRIQSKQTTNVDTVSGATYSSNGIIQAVRNALAKAGGTVSGSNSSSGSSSANNSNASKTAATATTNTKKKSSRKSKTVSKNATYKDGTYTGTGTGFGGDIKVKVVIKNGKIKSVTVTSHNGETEPYYSKASVLTKTIVQKQSSNVDAVSGATFSSNGILDAVDQALQKATVKTSKKTADNKNNNSDSKKNNSDNKGSDNNNSSDNNNGSGNNNSSDDNNGKSDDNKRDTGTVYNPGTYSVTSMVYADEEEDFTDYEISLDVTVANDKVTAVSNIKNQDNNAVNASYLKRAANGSGSRKGVVTQIVAAGNADNIDAVSGATCSSEGIINGVKDALTKALKPADSQTSGDDAQNSSQTTDSQADTSGNSRSSDTGTEPSDDSNAETTEDSRTDSQNASEPAASSANTSEDTDTESQASASALQASSAKRQVQAAVFRISAKGSSHAVTRKKAAPLSHASVKSITANLDAVTK